MAEKGIESVDSVVLPITHITGSNVKPRTGDKPALATITFQTLLTEEWPTARALIDEALRQDQAVSLVIGVAQPTFHEAVARAEA